MGRPGRRALDRAPARSLLFTFFLCGMALLVTPYGTELAAYPVLMATTQPVNIANILEWHLYGSGCSSENTYWFCCSRFLWRTFFPPWKYRLQEMAMLLFGVYAVCVHIRFLLVFLMTMVPFLQYFWPSGCLHTIPVRTAMRSIWP